MADRASKAEYEKAAKEYYNKLTSACNIAMDNFMSTPNIKAINLSESTVPAGSSLITNVTNDFKVAALSITKSNPDSSLAESATSVQQPNTNERFNTATEQNDTLAKDKITITEHDKPRNEDVEVKGLQGITTDR